MIMINLLAVVCRSTTSRRGSLAPYEDQIYGYVRLPHKRGKININKLGAQKDDSYIENMNVIWTAKDPWGGTCIVGWYKNATVYREFKNLIKSHPVKKKIMFLATALFQRKRTAHYSHFKDWKSQQVAKVKWAIKYLVCRSTKR